MNRFNSVKQNMTYAMIEEKLMCSLECEFCDLTEEQEELGRCDISDDIHCQDCCENWHSPEWKKLK